MCQFTSSVLKALQSTLDICETFYWTDSSIVLSWVINIDKVYKTYVQRRLIEIREFISDFEKFILVPLKLNPTDLGTNIYPQKNYLVTNYGLLILNFSVYREIVGHICMLEKKFQIIILIIVV